LEVKILKVSSKELQMEIKGEDYTLLNLLQKTLLENPGVEAAGSRIPHRLLGSAIFTLRVKGDKPPFEVLFEALDRIKSQSAEFRKAFQEGLKAWKSKG